MIRDIQFKQTARNQYQIWTDCNFSKGGVYIFGNVVFDYRRNEFAVFHNGHNGRLIGYATTLENCELMLQRSLRYGTYYNVDAPVFHFYK